MKYIKHYEKSPDETERIVVGDHVKYIKNTMVPIIEEELYIVTKIDLPLWSDQLHYRLSRMNFKRQEETLWATRDRLILIPEFVIAANKYNL